MNEAETVATKKNHREGVKKQKYKLPCDHIHAGEQYHTGDELELFPDQIERIKSVHEQSKAGA